MNFIQICVSGLDGRAGLNLWEGRTAFFYLDSRKVKGLPSPLVTVGVGCAVPLQEALTLPWTIDGRPACQAEIAADYAAIERAPFGLKASAYAKYTRVRLLQADIDALIQKRFDSFIPALQHAHPGFDSWPETAKAACLDLIYGVGVAGYCAPHYPMYHAALDRRNFTAAAAQCGADSDIAAYNDRNQARKLLFLAAAKG